MLAEKYKKYFDQEPKTFFDCGAATGVIVQMAFEYGMNAHGIDVRKYPEQYQPRVCLPNNKTYIIPGYKLRELFDNNHIEIKSILDCAPIKADIAYCNGVLTYFDEKTLPYVLSKFKMFLSYTVRKKKLFSFNKNLNRNCELNLTIDK